MARTTGRCARKKKPGAPAPLHTLQGLRALARIESPGGPRFFYFFFWVVFISCSQYTVRNIYIYIEPDGLSLTHTL